MVPLEVAVALTRDMEEVVSLTASDSTPIASSTYAVNYLFEKRWPRYILKVPWYRYSLLTLKSTAVPVLGTDFKKYRLVTRYFSDVSSTYCVT